jgi:ATP-dependent DNA ligase
MVEKPQESWGVAYCALERGWARIRLPAPAPYLLPAMLLLRAASYGFIRPALPCTADHPPVSGNWIHEIKHDGYRLMVRRDGAGVRLLTRNGRDWSARFPLILEAAGLLRVRSCLIGGEAVVCNDNGLAVFERLRRKHEAKSAFLYAFDLLELDGVDLWHEPIETRKATLASVLRGSGAGLRLNEPRIGTARTSPLRRRNISSASFRTARWW